jgi:hypothetical protein
MVCLGGVKVPALSRVFARLRTLRALILVYQENMQLPILSACCSFPYDIFYAGTPRNRKI